MENATFIQGIRPCCQEGCNGQETTVVSYTGPIIILEVYDIYKEEQQLELRNIPQELKFSFMEETYKLNGVIHFKSPIVHTRQLTEFIGHYTAISYHKNGKWYKYDDCKNSE
ncbi:uncharacterized protein LOC116852339 [Odontomachus brunneus]|uniref:uncharacterized protein LOC116852339 n=1 Tax=Odontomachus brunneus TaxID=486640 RepID=UPI0013F2070E|nr:uncharacterized protein LOC116852339 [Odontomachus brunneus]